MGPKVQKMIYTNGANRYPRASQHGSMVFLQKIYIYIWWIFQILLEANTCSKTHPTHPKIDNDKGKSTHVLAVVRSLVADNMDCFQKPPIVPTCSLYTGVLNIQVSAFSLSIDFNANLPRGKRLDMESPWYSDHDLQIGFPHLHVYRKVYDSICVGIYPLIPPVRKVGSNNSNFTWVYRCW